MIHDFADCVIDETTDQVSRSGEPVHVEPQVFDLLVALARVAPGMLSYDDMIEQVWQGRIVSDATLSGPVAYFCRLGCRLKPLSFRRRRDFSSPVLSADGVACISRVRM